jgi:hypothetical protein
MSGVYYSCLEERSDTTSAQLEKPRRASPPAAEESKRSKMFFHIVLERNMQLHPRHFGPHLRDKLVSKLIKDVEGTCR